MRNIAIAFFAFLLMPVLADAAVLKTEELEPFTARVMTRVGAGDLNGAFQIMKPYLIIPVAEFDTLRLGTKSQRDMVGSRFGKAVGFECLGKETRGQSLIRITCIERAEKHALPWRFYFYKTPKGWVLNTFTWNDNLPSLFPAN